MNKILNLYDELNRKAVKFYHWDLGEDSAATLEVSGKYGIFMDFSNIENSAQETVILAHEAGHIATGATHRIGSPYDLVERHEYKANKWAVKRLITTDELDEAVANGYTDMWALAEHFGVTEDFMRMAVCWHVHGNLASELYF